MALLSGHLFFGAGNSENCLSRFSSKLKHNKRFKRDSQRAAFLSCVGFCGYGVMRKLGNGVGCPLTGRYMPSLNLEK
ncbi:hypothetical protein CRN62_11845 [Vibrio vulnificus]|nr:hypothetical protein CRN62_11845 [Vibrio vulnificus]